MSTIAIHCEGIGKRYRMGQRQRYRSLRDTLADALVAPFRWLRTALGADLRDLMLDLINWSRVCFRARDKPDSAAPV